MNGPTNGRSDDGRTFWNQLARLCALRGQKPSDVLFVNRLVHAQADLRP